TVGPAAGCAGQRGSLPDLSFLSDNVAHAIQFFCESSVEIDDLVDGVVNFTGDPGAIYGQAGAEVSLPEVRQNAQKQTAIQLFHEGKRLGKFFSHIKSIATGRTKNQRTIVAFTGSGIALPLSQERLDVQDEFFRSSKNRQRRAFASLVV